MIRAVSVAGAGRPHPAPSKHWHKNQEKQASHFEPNDSADTAERTQKSTQPAADGAPGLGGNLRGSLPGGEAFHNGFGHHPARLGPRRAGGGLNGACQVLAHNAPGDSYSNPKGAADDLWSHSVKMVAAVGGA